MDPQTDREEADRHQPPEPNRQPIPPASLSTTIAPWWHTVLMVVLITGLSFTGARNVHREASQPFHLIPNYAATIVYEWFLAALAFWGLRLRGLRAGDLLGNIRSGWRGWWIDCGVALVFWVIAVSVLAILSRILARIPGSHMNPDQIAEVTSKLAPKTGVEIVLFLALSISAGICEEFVFRGYFQQQFAGAAKALWVGVIISAVLFGLAHGYEGLPGMVLITAYGVMFSILAIKRKGLRPGMIAHAWHDGFSGLALVFLHHYASRFGPR